MEKEVRVRFAPSPTGPLHIGGVRTALYNYLYAKRNNGKFLLRIEDTDQTRFVKGAEQYVRESLEWLGIKPDEGQGYGGDCGPYKQSERSAIYNEYSEKLVSEGKAYYAFDTPEELEAMRERLKAARVVSPKYNAITRSTMKNSLTLPKEEVDRRLAAGDPFVVRLKVPRKEDVRFKDAVRGWVLVNSDTLDDKILMKSDGLPTYHLANIVDDHLMKITHVIRGEEWLPSAPVHVLLYQYFGWDTPEFCHLPLILKPEGNGKLSKRDGDKHGFPVFPLDWTDPETGNITKGFREQGYLPEAVINFLSLLGWNPGDNREMFSLDELCEEFSIGRIGKAGAKFDIDKANWFNQQYLKSRTNSELGSMLQDQLKDQGITCSDDKAEKICEALKERIVFAKELWSTGKYFFILPESYDEKVIKKKWTTEAVDVLLAYKNKLSISEETFNAELAKGLLNEVLEEKGLKIGKILQALRVAVTGVGAGADLMFTLEILGKTEIINRIEIAIERLSEQVK